jgi:hypothetical protein
VYGDKTPSERHQVGAREWRRIVGESSRRQPSHLQQQTALSAPVNSPTAPPSAGNEPSDTNTADTPSQLDDDDRPQADLARLYREGGGELMTYLLNQAIPVINELPQQLRDIQCMPEAQKKEWYHACQEEIEVLRHRNVFELVELLKGAKVIKNRWVFAIKSLDNRKKARLVAKGFSQ